MNTNTNSNPSPASLKPRKRRFRTEQEWRKLIERFEQSDMTQTAFCRQQGIAASGFHLWRKRLAGESPNPHSENTNLAVNGFIPLALSPEPKPSLAAKQDRHWQVELELAPGCTLRIGLR